MLSKTGQTLHKFFVSAHNIRLQRHLLNNQLQQICAALYPYVTKSKQSNPTSETLGSISNDANVKTKKLALVISKSANTDDSWKIGSKQR